MAETERILQSYPTFVVEFMPNSHRYAIHKDNDKRRPVPSVTSALNVLSKDALLRWYGRMDSEAVLTLERQDELRGLSIGEAWERMRDLRLGAEGKRDEGAARGTAVHDALQMYCENRVTPALGAFDQDVRGHVSALCDWLLDARPEPVLVERIVGSPKYGFAGRFDLIAEVDGVRSLIDAKTSRNAHMYPESHIQLRGYELAFPECGIEPVERALVLYLGEDGRYQTAMCKATGDDFLAVLATHRAIASVRSRLREKVPS